MSAALGMCPATLLADPMGGGDADVRVAGEACVATGITDVSVWAHHWPVLSGLGLHLAVVEAAMTWANADPEEAAEEADRLCGLAAAEGASKIVAVTLEPSVADWDHARSNLGILVQRAEELGAQVVVEFLPWSGIPDLATAWRLVEPLGPGAGLLLDTWHWQRQPGGPAPDLLASIPGERIGYIQVCDAAASPAGEPFEEAMSGRLLPGDGVVDFRAFFDAVHATGATPFVATEIFNPSLVTELGSEGAAKAMAAATLPLL